MGYSGQVLASNKGKAWVATAPGSGSCSTAALVWAHRPGRTSPTSQPSSLIPSHSSTYTGVDRRVSQFAEYLRRPPRPALHGDP
jgi:hypothetical protein